MAVRAGALRWTRRGVQGAVLVLFLFLFLQTEGRGDDTLGYPVRLFLDFDPLILLSNLLSAHAASLAFYLSIITVLVTIVLGRVFCGWLCPLGTLNNIVGTLAPKPARKERFNLYWIKYALLGFLLISAAVGLQLIGLLDPLSLLIRSMALAVYPLITHALNALFGALYNWDLGPITEGSEAVYGFLKEHLLPFRQPLYRQPLLIGAVFALVLGLNLLERRLWCRHLCPLGALLGVLSRFSILKRSVSEACTECGSCQLHCQGGSGPHTKSNWRDAECYYCISCDDACPEAAVSFGFAGQKARAPFDITRRHMVVSAASALVAAPLIKVAPPSSRIPVASLIRPPGALEESEFLLRCVRCGECMKVCLTGGLQPALFEAGAEGLWSPVLVPRIGYCQFRCTLCGQTCPTGAIKRLTIEDKATVKIGLAMIDKGRCLPYAHGRPCIVCEEVCPTPKKAIWLEEVDVRQRDGSTVRLKQPRVDLELCVGCGLCEAKCPVADRAAIYVTSVGESRSKVNQILL